MKIAPFTYGVDTSGRKYWRSLDEFGDSPEFRDALAREFPDGASELADGVTRRSFMSLMGASIGLAGLVGCRRPEEKILPYARPPEELIPGEAQYYATAYEFGGTAIGLLVESHLGRPTKIEGNPRHPESLGATNVFAQASVLNLYDPERSTTPSEKGVNRTWDQASAALRTKGRELAATGGRGLVVLTEEHRSPTTARVLDELKAALPQALVVRWSAAGSNGASEGARLAFGTPLVPVHDWSKAKVVATLDADEFMYGDGPVRHARAFANGRRVEKPGASMNRLYSVESTFTVTGANADHRLRLRSSAIPAFVATLARELSGRGVAVPAALTGALGGLEVTGKAAAFAKALASDLAANRGSSLLAAGPRVPAATQALVHALNGALENVGSTVTYVTPFAGGAAGTEGIAAVAKAMQAGEVQALVMLGGNPAFDAPADLKFAEGLAKVPFSAHLSDRVDETSALAGWHLNRAHYLEQWSDAVAADGLASVVQPLIAPLFGGRTDAEIADLLTGGGRRAYELVRATWQGRLGNFEQGWRRALHEGVIEGTRLAPQAAELRAAEIAAALQAQPRTGPAGLEITFQPDSHAYDGRFANNGWMQEMPDQLTKLTWGNAAHVSPATARGLGLVDGDLVRVSVTGAGAVALPVVIAPGQADDSVNLSFGQGRTRAGKVGTGVGVDTYPLRTTTAAWIAAGQLEKTGGREVLARTQEHFNMEGRPLVREQTLVQFTKNPTGAKEMVKHPPLLNIVEGYEYNGHKWGMTIDLNACIGCNACMIACQSENNIPVVGKDGVIRSREMHWLRIDRYFEGEDENEPRAAMQPIGCQHCENAPCENVCPVAATSHSPEGLNDMAYNRCVGTRYCANNCPYKVRRFNFFNYNYQVPELLKMQKNPDVTVRARGVMEKCTYCVQRIQQAKITAKREGRDRVRDGEVISACAQGCPTNAIQFGDLNDPTSQVARAAALPHAYQILAEINTRPRTTFLARIRNPNPELEGA